MASNNSVTLNIAGHGAGYIDTFCRFEKVAENANKAYPGEVAIPFIVLSNGAVYLLTVSNHVFMVEHVGKSDAENGVYSIDVKNVQVPPPGYGPYNFSIEKAKPVTSSVGARLLNHSLLWIMEGHKNKATAKNMATDIRPIEGLGATYVHGAFFRLPYGGGVLAHADSVADNAMSAHLDNAYYAIQRIGG